MAAYFQLYRVGDDKPSSFQDIDNAICQNLGFEWDAVRYAGGWYDVIGFKLACGKTFEQITDDLQERINDCPSDWKDGYRQLLRINHYLLEHYQPNAWFGR